jgi:hypothetical protein
VVGRIALGIDAAIRLADAYQVLLKLLPNLYHKACTTQHDEAYYRHPPEQL